MAFCVVTAYAAVYLQGIGCSNQELGVILALGNVGGAVLSPALGALIDRNRRIRHAAIVNVLLAIQVVLLILLRVHPSHDLLTAICYVLYISVLMPVNAVNLDLCVRLERTKAPLNFGFARSMGSFSFVILSTLLGVVTARWGYLTLPFTGLAVVVLQFIGNRFIDRDLLEAEAAMPPDESLIQAKSSSLVSFVKENRMFCLMLFGTIILFISHNMDGNFLINEIRNLGGDTAIMGLVAAFTAITEIPVMMFSDRLPKRWQTVQYIRLALVFFTIKILAYALAPNIPLFFAARTLQAPSYALYSFQYDNHRVRAGQPHRRSDVRYGGRPHHHADRRRHLRRRHGYCSAWNVQSAESRFLISNPLARLPVIFSRPFMNSLGAVVSPRIIRIR